MGNRDSFGRYHGKGTLNESNGASYSGDWVNGEKAGKGTQVWVTGERYTGEWLGNAPAGKGVKLFNSGDKYVGEFIDGKMSGNGTYYFVDTTKYIGEWLDDQPHGEGVKTLPNATQCVGQFKLGKLAGQGECRYPNGDQYKGQFREDLADGEGVMVYANRNIYDGNWKAGKRHGQGNLKYFDGGRYSGAWLYDRKHGEGVLNYSNGDLYEGGWALDQKSGEGVFITQLGTRYEGLWRGGVKHGMGKLTTIDDKVYLGLFSNNKKQGLGRCTEFEITRTCRFENDIEIPITGLAKIEGENQRNLLKNPLSSANALGDIITASDVAPQSILQSDSSSVKNRSIITAPNKNNSTAKEVGVFYFEHNMSKDGAYYQEKNAWWEKQEALFNDSLTITTTAGDYFVSIVVNKYRGPGIYPIGQKSVTAKVADAVYYTTKADPGHVNITQDENGLITGDFEFNAYLKGIASEQGLYAIKHGRFSVKSKLNP